jgi:hypothetical protein
MNTLLQGRVGAYHDVVVDVFDDEVTQVFDGSIATTFLQGSGVAVRILCWICREWGK